MGILGQVQRDGMWRKEERALPSPGLEWAVGCCRMRGGSKDLKQLKKAGLGGNSQVCGRVDVECHVLHRGRLSPLEGTCTLCSATRNRHLEGHSPPWPVSGMFVQPLGCLLSGCSCLMTGHRTSHGQPAPDGWSCHSLLPTQSLASLS